MRVHWLRVAVGTLAAMGVGSTVVSAQEDADESEPRTKVRQVLPTEQMTELLRETLPGGGKNLQIKAAGASIVITGQVYQVADVERATEIVEGMLAAIPSVAGRGKTPNFKVVNALTVAGDNQVQLEVSFAEVSRAALKKIGFNFWTRKAGEYAGGVLAPGQVPSPGLDTDLRTAVDRPVDPSDPLGDAYPKREGLDNPDGLPIITTPLTDSYGVMFATAIGGKFPISTAISVLSRRGYSRTLSEPTLVALSGEEASFLAGGEAPIPVPSGLGEIGIEYKKFGVELTFTPIVLLEDTVQLKLLLAVSDVETSSGIQVSGTRVPAFTKRESKTTIRLRDGQSFAIAGLLSDNVRSSVDKIPLLGDLPVIGMLFRSVAYQRNETELLVVVTVHIVRPLEKRPGLPGQYTTADPLDLELFLLGSIESKSSGSPPPAESAVDGGGGAGGPDASLSFPVGPIGFAR